MRLLGLSGLVPKRYRRTTIRVPGVRVANDLVEREFRPSAPNQLWVADIKYVRSWQGWLYLAAIVDCYSRRVVGWSMRTDLEASSSSTRSRWPWHDVDRQPGSCTTPIRARNTSR
jgi:putative transposase